jgi:NADPH:quinone reductase-like Zn-dependent oxidoreductase
MEMKAAIVAEAGKTPVYGDFREPITGDGEFRIAVSAAALSQVTKSRASGSHYSAPGSLPAVVGIDGVGHLQDGRRVYFVLPETPFGSMAQWAVMKMERCVPLPDGLDDVTAAAIAIPGMSSWAALKARAHLAAGEIVLVNGATGTAGRLAVQIAKHMGARKVIATGRDPIALQKLKAIGADVTIALTQPRADLEAAFKREFGSEGIDVVLDYVWGQSAEVLIVAAAKAGKEAVPIRFVQIGGASGADITLPSAALRSSALELMGSGIGSIPLQGLIAAIRGVMQAALPANLQIETQTVPLADVEKVWDRDRGVPRIVFVTS